MNSKVALGEAARGGEGAGGRAKRI